MRENIGGKVVGVDIGGSHIAAGEVSLEDKRVCSGSNRRAAIDSQASSAVILESWGSFLAGFVNEGNRDVVRFGIAMPGPFDYTLGISYIKELNKYDALYGINIKTALAEYLGIDASRMLFRNDAEAFLHGEVIYRAGLAAEKVVGITLGTGLGSAVSEKGQTHDVFRAIQPMHRGISEDYISSRWFSRRYEELSGTKLESVALLAQGDDRFAEGLFQEFAVNLAAFLDVFVEEENASTVVIGGNIARCLDIFGPMVKENMRNTGVSILQSALWEDAALVGAADLWGTNDDLKVRSEKKEIKIC